LRYLSIRSISNANYACPLRRTIDKELPLHHVRPQIDVTSTAIGVVMSTSAAEVKAFYDAAEDELSKLHSTVKHKDLLSQTWTASSYNNDVLKQYRSSQIVPLNQKRALYRRRTQYTIIFNDNKMIIIRILCYSHSSAIRSTRHGSIVSCLRLLYEESAN